MIHAYHYLTNQKDDTTETVSGYKNSEYKTTGLGQFYNFRDKTDNVINENKIRWESGMPLRISYGPYQPGVAPPVTVKGPAGVAKNPCSDFNNVAFVYGQMDEDAGGALADAFDGDAAAGEDAGAEGGAGDAAGAEACACCGAAAGACAVGGEALSAQLL
eukprot:tig00021179_g19265.t1